MNISGIVVGADRGQLSACVERVRALPGIEVHFLDPDGGRAVLTQETRSTEEQQEGLRRIQALPGVLHAALVYHYFEDDDAAVASTGEPSP